MDQRLGDKSRDQAHPLEQSSSAPSDSAPNSRSSAAPESNPNDDVGALLKDAFALARQHRWVADFLFQNDGPALHLPSLACGIQKASAALLDFSVRERPPERNAKESQYSLHQEFSARNALAETSSLCLIPILSRGHITLCVLIRKSSDGELSSADDVTKVLRDQGLTADSDLERSSLISCSRCAFDNGSTSLLSVESPAVDGGSYEVLFLSNDLRAGRAIVSFQFLDSGFQREQLAMTKLSSPLMGKITGCSSYCEDRSSCMYCGRATSQPCSCSLMTINPAHPMDFASFAKNMVPYSGTFSAEARLWLRTPNCKLRSVAPPVDVIGDMSVSVNHESVVELCRLASLNIDSGDTGRIEDGSGGQFREGSVVTSGEVASSGEPRTVDLFASSGDDMFWGRSDSTIQKRGPLVGLESKLSSAWQCPNSPLDNSSNMASADVSKAVAEPASDGGRFNYGSHTGVSTESLRRIRNREAAARSNMRRKEKLELLKSSLKGAQEHMQRLTRDERSLRLENEKLRAEASRRGHACDLRSEPWKER